MIYFLTWIFVAALYSPIFYQLYQSRWENIDYTHAYFILPVSLWLVWRKRLILRDLFAKAEFNTSGVGSLAAVFLGLLMFIFGWRQGYLFISSLSLIPVLWGVTRYLHGKEVAKILLFPIFYLVFLIPPPLGIIDRLTLPMRYGISVTTENLLHALHYPIERSGLLLTVNGHEIFMGAPCSGFRSLITMLALSVIYVYFIKGGFKTKLTLIIAGIPFALLGNLMRVMTMCLITFYAGTEAAEHFHYISGGIIFLVMTGCLLGLEHLLNLPQKNLNHV